MAPAAARDLDANAAEALALLGGGRSAVAMAAVAEARADFVRKSVKRIGRGPSLDQAHYDKLLKRVDALLSTFLFVTREQVSHEAFDVILQSSTFTDDQKAQRITRVSAALRWRVACA